MGKEGVGGRGKPRKGGWELEDSCFFTSKNFNKRILGRRKNRKGRQKF
jgi:hypothetical protein